jgi:hypothetical protein
MNLRADGETVGLTIFLLVMAAVAATFVVMA